MMTTPRSVQCSCDRDTFKIVRDHCCDSNLLPAIAIASPRSLYLHSGHNDHATISTMSLPSQILFFKIAPPYKLHSFQYHQAKIKAVCLCDRNHLSAITMIALRSLSFRHDRFIFAVIEITMPR